MQRIKSWFRGLPQTQQKSGGGDPQINAPLYSEKVAEALATIAQWDRQHRRKGKNPAPYLLHPLAVSAYVWDEGGNEDEAIAALFHDSIEDWDELTIDKSEIRPTLERFGQRVLEIVEACTDGEPEPNATKPPWFKRKIDHISKIKNSNDLGILRVVAADKLSNLRSVISDLRGEKEPTREESWSHFKGGVFGTEWYYQSMCDAVSGLDDNSRLFRSLKAELATLQTIIDPLRNQLSDRANEIQQALPKKIRQIFPEELNEKTTALVFSFEFARREKLINAQVANGTLCRDWIGDSGLSEQLTHAMNAEGDYWVYENWFKGGAKVHHASCRYCQNGNGQYSTRVTNPQGEWFGPFTTRQQAIERALDTHRNTTECKVCAAGGIE